MGIRAERQSHLEAWLRENWLAAYYNGTSYVMAAVKYSAFSSWDRKAGEPPPCASAKRMRKTAESLGLRWKGNGVKLPTDEVSHGGRAWERRSVKVAMWLRESGETNLWKFVDYINRRKKFKMSVPEVIQCLKGRWHKLDREDWRDHDTKIIVHPTKKVGCW